LATILLSDKLFYQHQFIFTKPPSSVHHKKHIRKHISNNLVQKVKLAMQRELHIESVRPILDPSSFSRPQKLATPITNKFQSLARSQHQIVKHNYTSATTALGPNKQI